VLTAALKWDVGRYRKIRGGRGGFVAATVMSVMIPRKRGKGLLTTSTLRGGPKRARDKLISLQSLGTKKKNGR